MSNKNEELIETQFIKKLNYHLNGLKEKIESDFNKDISKSISKNIDAIMNSLFLSYAFKQLSNKY